MRGVADLAAFELDRCVFIDKRPSLIGVTLHAYHAAVGTHPQLFVGEAAMLVMAIGTFHASFRNLVMKGPRERSFLVSVTSITSFGFGGAQQKFSLFW